MTNSNFKFVLIALFATGLLLSSCGNKATNKATTEQSEQSEQSEQQGKEYTSAYICPMHCEGSGSEEPGKCPVCNMDYVINEDHKHDGHNH